SPAHAPDGTGPTISSRIRPTPSSALLGKLRSSAFAVEQTIAHRKTQVNIALDHPATPYRSILAVPQSNIRADPGLAGYGIPIDFITRIQRDKFWKMSRRTMTMLRISPKLEYRGCRDGRRRHLHNGLEWAQLVGKDATTDETTVMPFSHRPPEVDQQQQPGQEQVWEFVEVDLLCLLNSNRRVEKKQAEEQQIEERQMDRPQTWSFVGVVVPPRSSTEEAKVFS
ncbi:MAG: hypothetical protein Q9226_007037, partial [Calogaya cf. arnoldii]